MAWVWGGVVPDIFKVISYLLPLPNSNNKMTVICCTRLIRLWQTYSWLNKLNVAIDADSSALQLYWKYFTLHTSSVLGTELYLLSCCCWSFQPSDFCSASSLSLSHQQSSCHAGAAWPPSWLQARMWAAAAPLWVSAAVCPPCKHPNIWRWQDADSMPWCGCPNWDHRRHSVFWCGRSNSSLTQFAAFSFTGSDERLCLAGQNWDALKKKEWNILI